MKKHINTLGAKRYNNVLFRINLFSAAILTLLSVRIFQEYDRSKDKNKDALLGKLSELRNKKDLGFISEKEFVNKVSELV